LKYIKLSISKPVNQKHARAAGMLLTVE